MPDFEYDASLYCDACEGSGEIEYEAPGGWDEPNYVTRKCRACGGTGYLTTHVRPIDFEDLAAMEEDDPCAAFAYRGGNP